MHPVQARNNRRISAFPSEDIFSRTEHGFRFKLKFKRALWEDSGKQCAYCGAQIENHTDMHVDHFVPRALGGGEDVQNLVCACGFCNMKKGTVSVEHFRISLAMVGTPLDGVITPIQARKLIEIGVNLPMTIPEFHYETVIMASEATTEELEVEA